MSEAGLPDYFPGTTYEDKQNIPKYSNVPQNTPKRTRNLPNGRKMYQQFPFQGPPKYTRI
jgi:hypothetical protein